MTFPTLGLGSRAKVKNVISYIFSQVVLRYFMLTINNLSKTMSDQSTEYLARKYRRQCTLITER
jgi:hypothetical protein